MSGENPYAGLVSTLDSDPPAFDETAFQAWYRPIARKQGIDQDPDNPAHHYDYRAAYMANATPDATGHWPSDFKLDGHPRRYMSPDGKAFAPTPNAGWTDTKTGQLVGATGQPNPYLEIAKDFADDQSAELQFNVGAAMQNDPDAYARRLAIARRLGVGHDAVAQDETGAKLEAEVQALDPDNILKSAPVLAAWLVAHPDHAAIAHDDVGPLSRIEWWLRAPAASVRRGIAQLNLSNYQYDAMLRGVDPQSIPGYLDLKRQATRPIAGENTLAGEALTVGPPGILPGVVRGFGSGVKYGLAAATGAIALGQAGPQIATPEEVVTVPTAFTGGTALGVFLDTYKQEAGGAYQNILDAMDERGIPRNYAAARNGAVLAGVVNGALEAGSTVTLLKLFPGMTSILKTATTPVKKALVQATVHRAVVKGALKIAAEVGQESLTEALQQGSTDLAMEGAVASQGGPTDFARIPKDMLDNFVQSSFAMWPFAALPGGHEMIHEAAEARRIQERGNRFAQAVESAKASKLIDRDPAAAEALIGDQVAAADGPPEVSVPVEAWQTYWQSKNVDPAEAATALSAGVSYAEAVKTGGDVAIPTEAYLARVAKTEHHAGLAPDLRVDPSLPTPREYDAMREHVRALANQEAATQDENAPVAADLETVLAQQLQDELGYTEQQATAQAEVIVAGFAGLGRATGQTAAEVLKTYKVHASREGLGAGATFGEVPSLGEEAVGPAAPYAPPAAPADSAPAVSSPPSQTSANTATATAPATMNPEQAVPGTSAPTGATVAPPAKTEKAASGGRQLPRERVIRTRRPKTMISAFEIKTPADVAVWLRSQGGIAADPRSEIKPGSEDYRRVPVAFRRAAEKGGRRIERYAEQLVEAGWFESDRDAMDWLRDYLQNPDTTALPDKIAGELTDEQIRKADEANALRRAGFASIEELRAAQDAAERPTQVSPDHIADRLEQTGQAAAAEAPARAAEILAAKPETIASYDLIPGEVVYLPSHGEVYTVTHDEEGNVVLDDGVDLTLGDQQEIEAVRIGEGAKAVELNQRKLPEVLGPAEIQHYAALVPDAGAGFDEQQFKTELPVRVTFPDGTTIDDVVKGLNDGHALARAASNWPSASRIEVLHGDDAAAMLRQEDSSRRGFIRFTKGGKSFDIRLLEDANLSTLLHEVAHAFLEIMGDAAETSEDEGIRKDYAAVLKYLGVESRSQIGEDQHEMFARSMEAYFREGRAPAPELAGAFARIRAWLLLVYRKATELHVDLTDEVREVFDRIFAGDHAIAQMEQRQLYAEMFGSAEAAGMTEAEFERYRQVSTQAREEARADLIGQLVHEAERVRKAVWREERAKVRAEVEAEINTRPEYRAGYFLRTGRMLDGSEVPPALFNSKGKTFKLDVDSIRAIFKDRKGLMRKLGLMLARFGGAHPDVIAPLFGFRSGFEMVKAIEDAPSRTAAINQETLRRMKETHGDLMDDGKLADAALDAVHAGEFRVRQFEAELGALHRRAGKKGPPTPTSILMADAERLIGRRPIRNVDAEYWRRAEATAARKALQLERKGDYEGALLEQQRRMLNYFLYREARSAREEAEKIHDLVRRSDTPAARAALGKAGQPHLDQHDKLLERFEFKPSFSLAESDRREALAAWVEAEKAANRDPVIPEKLLNERFRTHWKNLNLEELRGLKDALLNIQQLARLKNTLQTLAGRREFREAVDEAATGARANLREIPPRPFDEQAAGKDHPFVRWLALGRASILKIETLMDRLDGGNPEGPWHRYVLDPINHATAAEQQLQAEYTVKIAALLDKMPKEIREGLKDVIQTAAVGPITRAKALAIALNMGNEGNLEKLIMGGQRKAKHWDIDAVEEIVGHLTEAEWDFVQGVWDTLEGDKETGLWARIEAQQRRLTGLPPVKVKPQPFTRRFADGTSKRYAGGYYPVIYNPKESRAGMMQADRMFESGYARAVTAHGHVQERTGFVDPILLDLSVLPRHLNQVIHDLTHREVLTSVFKFVTDSDIIDALNDTVGEAQAALFVPWLRDIANNRNPLDNNPAATFSRFARSNTALATLGFSIGNALQNFSNFGLALNHVSPVQLTKALVDVNRHREDMRAWINERSPVLRDRADSLSRDVRELLTDYTKRGKVGRLQRDAARFAFWGMLQTDREVAYPVWLAAFREQIKKGVPDDVAARHADSVIRQVNSSGETKDLSQIERSGEFGKAVTLFYTYFGAVYQELDSMAHNTRQAAARKKLLRYLPRLLGSYLAVVVVPAISSELLRGKPPGDDEDKAEWFAKTVLLYPFMAVPIVRDAAGYMFNGREPRFTPLASILKAAGNFYNHAKSYVEGDDDDSAPLTDDGLRALGYLAGFPSSQLGTTASYIVDWINGDENLDDGVLEALRKAFLYRSPDEKKK